MSPWLLQFSPRCSPGDSLDLSPRPGRGRGPFTAAVAWSGVVTGSSLEAACGIIERVQQGEMIIYT